jgi:hypothetical protein
MHTKWDFYRSLWREGVTEDGRRRGTNADKLSARYCKQRLHYGQFGALTI